MNTVSVYMTVDEKLGLSKKFRLPWMAEGFTQFPPEKTETNVIITHLEAYITLLENIGNVRMTKLLETREPLVVSHSPDLLMPFKVRTLSTFTSAIVEGLKMNRDVVILQCDKYFNEIIPFVDVIEIREIPKDYECDRNAQHIFQHYIYPEFEVVDGSVADDGTVFKTFRRKNEV